MLKRFNDGGKFIAKNFAGFDRLHVIYERQPDEPDIGIRGVYEIVTVEHRGTSVYGQLSMNEIDLLEDMAASDYHGAWGAAQAAFAQ